MAIVNEAATHFLRVDICFHLHSKYFHISKSISCLLNPYKGPKEQPHLIRDGGGGNSESQWPAEGHMAQSPCLSHTASSLVEA